MLFLFGRTCNIITDLLCFGVGVGLIFVGVALTFNWLNLSEKSLRKDKRGALWLWTVAGLTLMFTAFLWWALTWPLTIFMDKIESVLVFPPEAVGAITFFKTVIIWFLIFVCIGVLIWVIVNSQQKEYQPY